MEQKYEHMWYFADRETYTNILPFNFEKQYI